MINYISGLLLGIVFGYVLRKSGICFTGLVRDIYLQKDRYNIILFLTIICVEGMLYYAFAAAGLIRIPAYLPPFSLLTVAVGSFVFGFGAVMCNGCLTATLVKCGDGRVGGWLYLAVFMASAYFFAAGHGIGLSKAARHIAVVDDSIGMRLSLIPLFIFTAMTALFIVLMIRHDKAYGYSPYEGNRYKGIRHQLFERSWKREAGPVGVGLVLGIAFLVSGMTGRQFGIAITTPVMSWIYMITKPIETCGGCNPFDEHFGWGSLLVLGIIIGSFITSVLSGEFKIMKLHRSEVVRGIIGAALMGWGGMWGLGCLLGNGLVGTAQFSLKSWYALVFLVSGIWTSTRVFFAPLLKD